MWGKGEKQTDSEDSTLNWREAASAVGWRLSPPQTQLGLPVDVETNTGYLARYDPIFTPYWDLSTDKAHTIRTVVDEVTCHNCGNLPQKLSTSY